jgi:hypothetical protein
MSVSVATIGPIVLLLEDGIATITWDQVIETMIYAMWREELLWIICEHQRMYISSPVI